MPSSLLAISRVLDKENYAIKIISRSLSDNPEKKILENIEDSVCLGISAMTGFQIYDGLKITKIVKSNFPEKLIICGGWHPSILPEQTVKDVGVDIVVNGGMPQLAKYEKEIWEVMEKSGCSMILTGAESGSQDALYFISKDMHVEEIIEFTKLCKKYNIKVLYSFLVGLPWSQNQKENRKFINQEYRFTFSLIDSLPKISKLNRFTYYTFLPYPGAPLFNRAVDLGLEIPKNLNEWSTYLMSPEDAFKININQHWITPSQAKITAMLTQYIFGLMDLDSYYVLRLRIPAGIKRVLFTCAYQIGLVFVKFRWHFKFFRFPIDYWVFTLFYKYRKLV